MPSLGGADAKPPPEALATRSAWRKNKNCVLIQQAFQREECFLIA